MPGPTLSAPPRGVRRGAALTLVFVGVLAVGAATGSWGADGGEGPPAAGEPPPARTAARPVERAAAESDDDGKSGTDAAAEAARSGTDQWSAVYTAREYEGFEQALNGSYVGVGLTTRRTGDGRMEVDGVQSGSPAERAGIAPGDRIRTIDGVEVTGRPVTEVVARLRGDEHSVNPLGLAATPGTPVRLGLQRGPEQWERTLHRQRLVAESVEVTRLLDRDPPVTRIKAVAFTKGTGERIRRAVRAAGPGEGILLDLRGNSGGLVAEAVTAASAFLDGGLVATYDVRGRAHPLEAEAGGDTARPLVVLVDGGTMSAAELLTGALQDRGRAVVVGTRTFGKGSVQMPSRLPGGAVAELTVGHYRTPHGRTVDGAGILPDLAARGDAEQRARTVLSGLGGGS